MSIMDGLRRGTQRNGGRSGVTFQDALKQVNDNPEECFRKRSWAISRRR